MYSNSTSTRCVAVLRKGCLTDNAVRVQKFSNVNFMRPLIKAMKRKNPDSRADAMMALEQWRKIRGRVFFLHRGARLHSRGEGMLETVVFDVVAFLRLGMVLSRRFIIWTARLLAFWHHAL